MNTFLKVLVWILSFLGGFFIICLLIGMVMSINDSDQKPNKVQYDVFETAFMDSCTEGKDIQAKTEYCKCSFDYMVNTLGRERLYEEVGNMENGVPAGRLKEVMTEAVDKCL